MYPFAFGTVSVDLVCGSFDYLLLLILWWSLPSKNLIPLRYSNRIKQIWETLFSFRCFSGLSLQNVSFELLDFEWMWCGINRAMMQTTHRNDRNETKLSEFTLKGRAVQRHEDYQYSTRKILSHSFIFCSNWNFFRCNKFDSFQFQSAMFIIIHQHLRISIFIKLKSIQIRIDQFSITFKYHLQSISIRFKLLNEKKKHILIAGTQPICMELKSRAITSGVKTPPAHKYKIFESAMRYKFVLIMHLNCLPCFYFHWKLRWCFQCICLILIYL